jgi:hypothetical protein
METLREDRDSNVLIICLSEDQETIKFTFSSKATFTYPAYYICDNSEYIHTNILRGRNKMIIDLYELGWDSLCPYLILFLEFIGGSCEYPLSLIFGLIFLKFSEFFNLQGSMLCAEDRILGIVSLNELHYKHREWWNYRIISIRIVAKVTKYAINAGNSCLEIMRGYLDWIDEKSFKKTSDVIKSNPFMMIQQLIKIQGFYTTAFKNKKSTLCVVCKEYEVARNIFDMQELFENGWL